jgi:hypothetical protein
MDTNPRSNDRKSARTIRAPESCGSPASTTRGCVEPGDKAAFIEPRLICHGTVADLTNQFGGSLTPEERESQGLD